jgi:hypothetical protein
MADPNCPDLHKYRQMCNGGAKEAVGHCPKHYCHQIFRRQHDLKGISLVKYGTLFGKVDSRSVYKRDHYSSERLKHLLWYDESRPCAHGEMGSRAQYAGQAHNPQCKFPLASRKANYICSTTVRTCNLCMKRRQTHYFYHWTKNWPQTLTSYGAQNLTRDR